MGAAISHRRSAYRGKEEGREQRERKENEGWQNEISKRSGTEREGEIKLQMAVLQKKNRSYSVDKSAEKRMSKTWGMIGKSNV